MKTILKIPFKILAIPFVPVCFFLGLAMRFLGWVSGRVLAILSLLFAVGGVILLCQGGAYSGAGLLVMAFLIFLISPFGLPALAEALAEGLHSLNGSLMGFIAG